MHVVVTELPFAGHTLTCDLAVHLIFVMRGFLIRAKNEADLGSPFAGYVF